MPTILLVEDSPATRELLVEFLERDGHTVLEAGTGLARPGQVESPRSPDRTAPTRGGGVGY